MPEKTRAEALHDYYREKTLDGIKSGTESFDRYLLTLSSGAFGLSVAFIKDIIPIGFATWIPCLIASWIAFLFCILITLVSFRVSIQALENSIPYLEEYYLKGNADAFNRHLKSCWVRAVDWCTYSAMIFFLAGLIFTMMFVGANIRKVKSMSKEDATTKGSQVQDVGKAVKPAAMTPFLGGEKPAAMTPVNATDDFGLKPPAMTPITPQSSVPKAPASQTEPTQSPKK